MNKCPKRRSSLSLGSKVNDCLCRDRGQPERHRPRLFVRSVKPQLPVDFEETSWNKLSDAVKAVQQSRQVALSLETLYRVHHSSRDSHWHIHVDFSVWRTCASMACLVESINVSERSGHDGDDSHAKWL